MMRCFFEAIDNRFEEDGDRFLDSRRDTDVENLPTIGNKLMTGSWLHALLGSVRIFC